MKDDDRKKDASGVVPTGVLQHLKVSDIKPSINNPRQLFDPVPLAELKESIRQHGVLVPITVFRIRGQEKYAILDGERRYKCCSELEDEGVEVSIPANIVEPPTKIAGLLYMFSIHNFREQWELMPTAISLKTVMDELGTTDNKKLSDLTGLSETQIERCKILLEFPEEFQNLSLEADPKNRIPSNFWIEANPVLKIYEEKLPDFIKELGRNALIQKFVDKYRNKKIVSVIHFRRIREASTRAAEQDKESEFLKRLREYIENENLETREAFDEFLPRRNVKSALTACHDFIEKMKGLEEELATENDKEIKKALKEVRSYLDTLLDKLSDEDAPKEADE